MIECRKCRSAVTAENINMQALMALCPKCSTVFSILPEGATKPVHRLRVGLPEKAKLESAVDVMRVTYRWFSPIYLFLLFFCIAWDSFLVGWYTMAVGGKEINWMMLVFPSAHLAVGVGLTYFTIAGFLNRTVVELSRGTLMISHGPLPWPGSRRLRASDLDQLYGTREVSHGKNGTSVTYELRALLRSGKMIKLLTGLDDPEQVLYLEQEIESRLGLVDRPVAGEMAFP